MAHFKTQPGFELHGYDVASFLGLLGSQMGAQNAMKNLKLKVVNSMMYIYLAADGESSPSIVLSASFRLVQSKATLNRRM